MEILASYAAMFFDASSSASSGVTKVSSSGFNLDAAAMTLPNDTFLKPSDWRISSSLKEHKNKQDERFRHESKVSI